MKMKSCFLFLCVLCVLCGKIYSQTGTIKEMSGEVTLKKVGQSSFVHANIGSQIESDTIISTGFKSTAIVAVGSSTIIVRPLTRLTLSEIQSSANSEKLNVNLQTGRVRVEVKPPAGARASVSVQSPSATASVRGTEFELDTQNITVYEGTVDYQGADGISIPVNAGSSSSVSTNSLGSGGGAVDPFDYAVSDLAPSVPVGTFGSGGSTGTSSIPSAADADFEFIIEWNK